MSGTPQDFLRQQMPNNSVVRDRLQAALAGSLRGFAAAAPPNVKRYAADHGGAN